VHAGRLGEADLPALEIGHRLDGRIGPHDDRLRGRRRRLLRDEGQLRARGLREHRHGVGHVGAEVEVVEIERFEQRQAAGELVPADLDAQRRELPLQRALGLEHHGQRRRLLVADADRGRGRALRIGHATGQ